ncbi:MAG: ubiquinol-cytochrome c reductase iron-sulfur subunit [Pseudomonadota bacterium]
MAATTTQDDEPNRRDFIHLLAIGTTGVGAAAVAWPFIDQLNPAANVRALASKEVDLSNIEVGQAIKVMWRGKPVFIRRRTDDEIEAAKNVELSQLKDKVSRNANDEGGDASDAGRVTAADGQARPEWLVLVGVCTHLGCIPLGTAQGEVKGDYDGWFCPCHGSHYDTSGRIRKGPAPENLPVPPYAFLSDTTIKIG